MPARRSGRWCGSPSGGELSRFILALKVALAEEGGATTMIFDEIDRGVGGAVASAVGERLHRLAARGQVLVVTHSPQVAARGARHLLIEKSHDGLVTRTGVHLLDEGRRREEIARMLSGAESPTRRGRRRSGCWRRHDRTATDRIAAWRCRAGKLLTRDVKARPRPVVMIFPNFFGLDEVDDENAERILGLGYSAFGCDLYGKGRRGGTREDGFARMNPLREIGRCCRRGCCICSTSCAACPRSMAPGSLRSASASAACACSISPAPAPTSPGSPASTASSPRPAISKARGSRPASRSITAGRTRWSPPEDVVALGRELTGAGCDWQIHCFGGAVHGFTHARPPEEGIPFNALADKRSWRAVEDFLAECFA